MFDDCCRPAADKTLNSTDDLNLQYTDISIAAGTTLTVPSGTVLRCTGSFTNDGTINVQTGAVGGRRRGSSATTTTRLRLPASKRLVSIRKSSL